MAENQVSCTSNCLRLAGSGQGRTSNCPVWLARRDIFAVKTAWPLLTGCESLADIVSTGLGYRMLWFLAFPGQF